MSEEQTNSGDGQGGAAANTEYIKLKVVGQVSKLPNLYKFFH